MTGLSRKVVYLGLALFIMGGIWFMTARTVRAEAAQGSMAEGKTYIEFIFDASASMREKVEAGKSRMEVAKEVMRELLQGLEDRPDLEIGLRVYGFLLPGKTQCEDSGLLQPFGPVDAVRSSILKVVESLEPRGMTPIGYSLQEAARDFPKGKDNRNVIVLVTDGEESCGADPCAISRKLQADGIILKPYVVGFGLSAFAETRVKCIGNYYSAKDRESLSKALKSIVVEVVSPPSLEAEAWAGGANVTAKTRVEVLDQSGKSMRADQKGLIGPVLVLSVAEGVYTVRGTLTVEGEEVTASQPNVTLKKGETTKVKLDFGDLAGKVIVKARADGKDVSDRIEIRVEKAGAPAPAVWSGIPPSATLPAGRYDFTVTHKDYSTLTRKASGTVLSGKDTVIDVDFGELTGKIVLIPKMGERDIPPSSLRARAFGGEKGPKDFQADNDRMAVMVAPGTYSVECTYTGEPQQSHGVENIKVEVGKTTEVPLTFDVPGTLLIKAMVDSKPSNEVKISVHQNQKLLRSLEPVSGERGVFEMRVLEGAYDIQAVPSISGFSEQWIRDVKVKSGETVEKQVAFNPSKIRVKVTADGKPYSKGSLSLYKHDPEKRDSQINSEEWVCHLEEVKKGGYETKVKEGIYDILAYNLGEGIQDKSIREVEIQGGSTLEKVIKLAGTGKLRLNLTWDGKPCAAKNVRPMVYYAGTDEYICDLEMTKKGVFEAKLGEGEYDVEISTDFGSQWVRDLAVTAGETLEQDVEITLEKE